MFLKNISKLVLMSFLVSLTCLNSVYASETAEKSADDILYVSISKNQLVDINDDKEKIPAIDKSILEKIKGESVEYNSFKIGDKFFEWFKSDYITENNPFKEEAYLVVTNTNNAVDKQVIKVKAEGGLGEHSGAEDRFVYTDVNFDGQPDLLVCTGAHGNQGAITYYCFLQTDKGFVENTSFADILNPAIDRKNKNILSVWRASATSHGWDKIVVKKAGLHKQKYVVSKELREEVKFNSEGKEYSVWYVNNKEIARDDKNTEEEIENLIFNDKNEWNLNSSKWNCILKEDF